MSSRAVLHLSLWPDFGVARLCAARQVVPAEAQSGRRRRCGAGAHHGRQLAVLSRVRAETRAR